MRMTHLCHGYTRGQHAEQLARCAEAIAYFRRIVDSGEPSYFSRADAPQDERVLDFTMALIGWADWSTEAEWDATKQAECVVTVGKKWDNRNSEAASPAKDLRPLSKSTELGGGERA